MIDIVFSLPHNWIEAPLQEVAQINPKLDKSRFTNELTVSFIPMPAVAAETGSICVSETRKFVTVKKGYTSFRERDVLFAKITPCMENGKMAVVPTLENGLGFGSTEFHVIRPYDGIIPEYIYYFVSSQRFRYNAEHNMTGAVGQRRVPAPYLSKCLIPIPPTQEQHRIVTKIEELFSELDKGIESLKTAREQLKVYRPAVLKHAFEGKLTAQWREENKAKLETANQLLARIQKEREARYQHQLEEWEVSVKAWEKKGKIGKKPTKPRKFPAPNAISPNNLVSLSELPTNWKWCKTGHLFDVYVGSTPSRKNAGYWGGAIPWVSSGEVAFCHINDTKEKITKQGYGSASTQIHPTGTVMLAMIGEGKTRGQSAILNIAAAHNQNTAAIRVSETDCSTPLFYYYLLYQYELTRNLGSGNNQKALNKDRVSNMVVPLAPIREQSEIASHIEKQISVFESFDTSILVNLKRAEALRQSILKKAFSGKLVEQDPNDEPASVLLERIKAEKAQPTPKKKTSKRKAATACWPTHSVSPTPQRWTS